MDTAPAAARPVLTKMNSIADQDKSKHSSGDLHSRLKTRKLLGVGETDDGDVHRSKLSQILGHSEQLYIRLPRGLRAWQLVLAIIHTATAIWALLFPTHLFGYLLPDASDKHSVVPMRCYGAVLTAFSVMSWCTFRSGDKDVIRSSLLASALYFTIQTVVVVFGRLQHPDPYDSASSPHHHHPTSTCENGVGGDCGGGGVTGGAAGGTEHHHTHAVPDAVLPLACVSCIVVTLVAYWYFTSAHPHHHHCSRSGSVRYK